MKQQVINPVQQYRVQQSGIPKEYLQYTWSKYNPRADINQLGGVGNQIVRSREIARDIAKNFAKKIQQNIKNGRSLIFIGKSSTGKTVLATLILKQAIIEMSEVVLYVNFSDLFYQISRMSYSTPAADDIIDVYIDPTLLCIDEIDMEDANPAAKDIFKGNMGRILTARRLQRKTTILTSRIGMSNIKNVCGNTAYKIITDRNYFEEPVVIIDRDSNGTQDIFNPSRIFNTKTLIKYLQEEIVRSKRETIQGSRLLDIIKIGGVID